MAAHGEAMTLRLEAVAAVPCGICVESREVLGRSTDDLMKWKEEKIDGIQ